MENKLAGIKLHHDSFISLHIQLHNALRQQIISGRWGTGERIPSEPQLAKHFNISRTTVRLAFQKAEIEGLITRVPGKGTFVSYNINERDETRFIGYVTRSFHSEIHLTLLSNIETALRSAGYNVIFSNADNNDQEAEVLQELLQDDIAGLILLANTRVTDQERRILQEYNAKQIPIVLIDRFVDSIQADFVASDNFGGTYGLVQHLIELGHQDIYHLTQNAKNVFPIDERHRGYYEAMEKNALSPFAPWQLNSPNQTEFFESDLFHFLEDKDNAHKEQMVEFIKHANPAPTAISCVNDATAILAIRAIRSMGLKVPDDISVVGFDDIRLAAYLDVTLTTAAQDAHTIAQHAADILLERLDGNNNAHQHITVPTRLQIRMSTTTPLTVNK